MDNELFESWQPVVGYEGLYKVSSSGQIMSIARRRTRGGMLKPLVSPNGYLRIFLSRDGTKRHMSIHRIVAEAFLANPLCLPQVNHKNGVKVDNNVNNLEWVTPSDNMRHAFRTGLDKAAQGQLSGSCKLSDGDVVNIRTFAADGIRIADIAKLYPVTTSNIYAIVSKKSWKHI